MFKKLYGDHVRVMQNRWEAAMLVAKRDAVLVHAGCPIVSFQDDYEYTFRPNPHFLAWLPLTRHPDSVLLIRPGERPVLWFYQPEDYWYLPPADPESWWSEHVEVRVVSSTAVWRDELPVDIRHCAALGDAAVLGTLFPAENINPSALTARLQLERTRKTDYEIACIAQANLHAAIAHRCAEHAFHAGKSEFDIHLAYLAACRQTDAELPYNSIVALNHHGAVLHYQQRDRQAPDQRWSFLIDAGSAVNAYAADVTRTYAAAASDFADLVSAMEAMQQRVAGCVAAGLDYRELHLQAHHAIAAILQQAGIVKLAAEDAVATGLSSVFFPHGLGHFVGLQVHDVAGLVDNQSQSIARPPGHPYLRLTRCLEPGNVLTIEPGLYFIAPLLNQWKMTGDASAVNWPAVERFMPYGGIRIEDNLVVTPDGHRNLTREAFAVE